MNHKGKINRLKTVFLSCLRTVKLMKKLSFYLGFLFILFSCNTTKRVAENEYLLVKNSIYVDSVKTNNSVYKNYVTQKPNNKTLGVPLSLYVYNLGNKDKPKTPSQWGTENKKSYQFVKSVFSEKQSIAYANFFIGFNRWLLENGQAPVVINDKKIKKSVTNLQTYLNTEGYFKSKVSYKKDTVAKKKGEVTYFINRGKPLFLDSIFTAIKTPVIDSLFEATKANSFLKPKEQYKDQNFRKEAGRITKLFRNSGVFHFSENLIGFYDIDTSRADYKTNVLLKISDRIVEKNGLYKNEPLAIQKIKNVTVYTDYSFAEKENPYLDTLRYKGFTFLAHKKGKYNPKYLAQSLFVKPTEVYSDSLRNLTRNHLKSLKNFKTIRIEYQENETTKNELNAAIFLTPTEKYTLGLDTELTHSNIRNIGISGKFSLTNRNAFKGAELIKFSALGSYFEAQNGIGWEIGFDTSIEIPRFLAPFGLANLVPKRMSPRTLFSVGTSIQKNIGLDRQTFSVIADYKWQFNRKKTIQLEIFNTQYVQNLNIGNYFDVYQSEFSKLNSIAKIKNNDANFELPKAIERSDEVVNFMNTLFEDANFRNTNPTEYADNVNIRNRYNIVTSDFLIPTIAYSFTYNNQSSFKDNNFSFFKFRIANSGNIMGLLSNTRNSKGVKTVFNIPIAQYFKTDIEYKRFWDIGNNAVFGFRTFLGVITPYDGASIPFTKSYFAGGNNDIRAWRSYELGPGSRNTGLEFNIGSLKLLTSMEYRFDIIGNFKGALFVDAGNIWDITNSSFVDEASKFTGFSSLEDIAVGSGFGIRYDLNFLVVRLDFGFKTYEPYLEGEKWFQNYDFASSVFNIGINYPF